MSYTMSCVSSTELGMHRQCTASSGRFRAFSTATGQGGPAGVDVPYQVVLKDGHAVIHIRPALPVGEAVEEAPEAQPLGLLPLLALHVLRQTCW